MTGDRSTICALASGKAPSGVAVIRVSGPAAMAIQERLTGAPWAARSFRLLNLKKGDGALLDRALVLDFSAPASFTGEDVAEFHVHGGPAVIRAVIGEICRDGAARLAEPGEFTRRAFLNGKMDLVTAENLAGLIAAETETQRRLAIANADGRTAQRYEAWRRRLVSLRATIEAELDFVDEGDAPAHVRAEVVSGATSLADEIRAWSAGYRRAEIVRDGFRVVLLGAPNAGKSSLLNALARREVALVSDEPGTTRDAIEIALDIGGQKIVMTDTAGLREGAGVVEGMGIALALERAREADLILWLSDGDAIEAPGATAPIIRVATKKDIGRNAAGADVRVSAHTGDGLGELIDEIARRAQAATGSIDAMPTHWREAELLSWCEMHLRLVTDGNLALELMAEELRIAGDNLGRITGSIGVEDLLDDIFSRFCMGK